MKLAGQVIEDNGWPTFLESEKTSTYPEIVLFSLELAVFNIFLTSMSRVWLCVRLCHDE